MSDRGTRRTSRALTLEFLFQNLFSYATEGVVFTGLALWLGATTLQIGLLGSIGGFGFTAILAAPWLVRAARRLAAHRDDDGLRDPAVQPGRHPAADVHRGRRRRSGGWWGWRASPVSPPRCTRR